MQALKSVNSSDPLLWLRLLGPWVLAFGAVLLLQGSTTRKRLLPPGFAIAWRRTLAWLLVAGFFWLAVFSPLGLLGLPAKAPVTQIEGPELFVLHALMAVTVGGWFLLGFAGLPRVRPVAPEPGLVDADGAPLAVEPLGFAPEPSLGQKFAVQLGLAAPNVWREMGLGLMLGIGAWLFALGAILVVALAIYGLLGEGALPKQVPSVVPMIAGLPVILRLLVSLSAGFFEELFFRGFLQPRIGILLSTVLFALGHLSYGQPFLLVGVTVLSLILGLIVKWRQNIWPAVVAHAVFDAVQLLVIVPIALRNLPHG
jgi:membrane protease YdiL (CAAX protease family)